MSGKVFIRTHGCQMNEYDSDKMQDVLMKSHGMSITEVEEEADVILINGTIDVPNGSVFSKPHVWMKFRNNALLR